MLLEMLQWKLCPKTFRVRLIMIVHLMKMDNSINLMRVDAAAESGPPSNAAQKGSHTLEEQVSLQPVLNDNVCLVFTNGLIQGWC